MDKLVYHVVYCDYQWPYAELNNEEKTIIWETFYWGGKPGTNKGWCVCGCGPVQMDRGPIWTKWGHNRNQSIKAKRDDSGNLALSSSTYPGVSYKLNPAVRMGAWKEMSRGSWPWKHKSNVAGHGTHRESQGKPHGPSLCMPDGVKIWVDGWWKSLKTSVLSQPPSTGAGEWYISNMATVAGWPHTTLDQFSSR